MTPTQLGQLQVVTASPIAEFAGSAFGRAILVGGIAAAGSKAFPGKILGPFILGTLLAFVVGVSPRPRGL